MDFLSSSDDNLSPPSRPSRRMVLGLALGAALGGVGVSAGLTAAKPKRTRTARRQGRADALRQPKRRRQRRPRYKVVTRTFSSTAPIAIPFLEASPYPATIRVGGLRAGKILDVNVTLSGLSDDSPGYLDVVLVAPNGLRAVGLLSDAGDDFDVNSVTLVFDDQAAGFLPYDAQIVSGSYKPTLPGVAPRPETAALRSFNGLNPNGTWRLYVFDNGGGDPGSIASWSLTIKARVRA